MKGIHIFFYPKAKTMQFIIIYSNNSRGNRLYQYDKLLTLNITVKELTRWLHQLSVPSCLTFQGHFIRVFVSKIFSLMPVCHPLPFLTKRKHNFTAQHVHQKTSFHEICEAKVKTLKQYLNRFCR